ncbi:MAG: glycosyltransferase [Candidatus Omnitrophota bacterium]|nr:glycosyltransferase [Candidatus Omnitrophota bacterium]
MHKAMQAMTDSRKNILFIMQDLEMGGAEQLKLCIQKYINKEKYRITYCCINRIGIIGEEVIKNGGNVICLNINDKFYNLAATYKLYKLVRKIKPDLIQSALFNANFHARIVGMLVSTPVIIEEHGMYAWKRWYHILIDRILSGFTYKIIVPSKSVKDFLMAQEALSSDKIEVLYNCVDLDLMKSKPVREDERRRLGAREDVFVVGAVGTLRKEKGHDILLDAFKIVLAECKSAMLFIVGDGYLYRRLTEKSRMLSIEKNVIFLGRRLGILGFLSALDLFVMPSLSEGLGIALLEAASLRVPCVASEVGGINEIAEELDGITLVKPNNAYALAGAIINKIENKAKSAKAAYAEVKVKEIFTPGFYINRLEGIYNKALN